MRSDKEMKLPSSKSSYVAFLFFATILSVQKMFRNNPDLNEFTHLTDHHEPNLSFHFAIEMWQYLRWLNCDFDVWKEVQNKRPDLLFHHRGTCDENFLVVEVKRYSNRYVVDWEACMDKEKIYKYWFGDDLHYRYGLSLVLNEETFEVGFSLLERMTGASFDFGPKRFDDPDLEYDFIDEILASGVQNGIDGPGNGYATIRDELEMFLARDFKAYPLPSK